MIVSSCAETVWIDELDEASEGSYMQVLSQRLRNSLQVSPL